MQDPKTLLVLSVAPGEDAPRFLEPFTCTSEVAAVLDLEPAPSGAKARIVRRQDVVIECIPGLVVPGDNQTRSISKRALLSMRIPRLSMLTMSMARSASNNSFDAC